MNITRALKKFFQLEAASGILLFCMALLALILDNSIAQNWYESFRQAKFTVGFNEWVLSHTLEHWINDGLMAIFFLLVSLEIKREILIGELNSKAKLALPSIAAFSGVLFPALIYFYFNQGNVLAMRGWAVPVATDIAFALGALALLGERVPLTAKVFLTALAILDDLIAIVIIAVFYTHDLSFSALGWSMACLAALFLLNRSGVRALAPYFIIGIVLWLCVLKSGVHATLAGVALGFMIPMDGHNPGQSPLHMAEHRLHPWVAFFILPLFAFANAGLTFEGIELHHLYSSIPLGIALGLFLGKQLGIWGACWVAVKLGIAQLPSRLSWVQLYGVALLCGIGFTMSLFIGNLAFQGMNAEYAKLVRIGVFSGSLASGLLGYLFLFCISSKKK